MQPIEDIIQYENESTSVEFKAVQYEKASFAELIKDIMAMANATIEGPKYIIVGVKNIPSGTNKLLGIPTTEFVDSATYQQLIRANIEPDVSFEYLPVHVEEKLFGVFRISATPDKPYMMRKDYQPHQKGDAFIRKGDHVARVTRSDIELMIKNRNIEDFSSRVFISFSEESVLKTRSFKRLQNYIAPSVTRLQKLEQLIAQKEQASQYSSQIEAIYRSFTIPTFSLFDEVPDEQCSIDDLKKRLKNVKSDYRTEDAYDLFERHAHLLELFIINEAKLISRRRHGSNKAAADKWPLHVPGACRST